MILLILLSLPVLAGVCLSFPAARALAAPLLVVVGFACACLAVALNFNPAPEPIWGGYLRVDATSRLFIGLINPIFLGISVYILSRVSSTPDLRAGMGRFAFFCLCFLASANFALVSNHLLVAWVALEGTSLAAAPLIVRGDVPNSRLASWRYLLFSSVGLGLALLGFLCLAKGGGIGGSGTALFIDRLAGASGAAPDAWTRIGLVLTLLGLGTKLGLAPMYNWLPEVYDEAPPSAAALLAAIQFNCVLAVLIRIVGAYRAGNSELVTNMLILMGGLSMMVSTFNIIGTRNVKRLIAYASINHAGVIAIGLGVGVGASYGLLLYAISNAFIKAILFLAVGKIKAQYRTKDTRRIVGLVKDLPYSGAFLMVGTFALLGFPPFGSFFGELLILSALVGSGHMLVFGAFCALIIITFVATGRTIFPMIWGEPKEARTWPRQTFISAAPKMCFLAALIVLGVYIPASVNDLISEVALTLDAR